MANVLSLALKINADATGLKLTPVERALQRLGAETDKVTSVFDKFSGTSEAAARAQADTARSLEELTKARQAGTITAQEFADQFAKVRDAALEEAAALQRAAQITEANLTPLQRYDRALEELDSQLQAGRISQETYDRATQAAAKGLTDAERAARGLAVQQKEIDAAASNTTLKFNELSGVFSALPGPIGNVAGRISGLASAGEGLQRIFAGGLQQGFANLAGSVTQLINPVTATIAGLAAFGAGATAVARGLIDLEDRVERLGNQAAQLGVSFEFIQIVEETARRSGVSVGSLEGAFTRLQRTLSEAGEGSKTATDALNRLGLTFEQLSGLSPEEQFNLIGERIAAIEDPAQRTAAAVEIFGRSGAQLLPFFNNLPGAGDDIERFGRALTDLDKRRVDELGASLDALSVATQGLGQTLLLPFAGLGDGISRALAEVTAGITAIVDPIGRILEPAFTAIGVVVEGLGIAIGTLGRVVGAVFEPFADVVGVVSQALEPLYDGVLALVQGIGDAAVAATQWIASFTPIGAISAIVDTLGETISRVVTIITTAFSRVGEFVGGLVSQFGELLSQSPLLQALGNTISSVFGSVASVFSTIANAIGGFVGRLLTIAENFLGIDNSAQQAADSTSNLSGEIEELTEEESKAAAERDKFLQSYTNNVSKAIDESARFGQAGFDAALQYQEGIKGLQDQLDRGIINEEVFRREAAALEATYDAQIKAAQEAQAQVEANTRRVDELLSRGREVSQIERDLNAVESEINRVQSELAAARAAGAAEEANRLAARLAQLDQVQQSLIDQSEEAAQGFAEGFDAAFAEVDNGLDGLIDQASEFGNEGALAAQQLTDGIAAAQEQVRDGILNREAFEAEVARQKELFDDRVAGLREAAKITEQTYELEAELLEKQFEIEKARAEELANIRTGAIAISDFRDGGVSQFFDTLREDPAIAEAKKQSAELAAIRKNIEKLNAERVDILAGTG